MHQHGDANDTQGQRHRLVTVADGVVHGVVSALVGVRGRRSAVPAAGQVCQRRVALVDALASEKRHARHSLQRRPTGVHLGSGDVALGL